MTRKPMGNDALREGRARLSLPAPPQPSSQTRPADLGHCLFPNLDSVWEVRIPTNPITHSNRKAITIPSHADHFRSGATRACFIMRKRQRIVKPSAF